MGRMEIFFLWTLPAQKLLLLAGLVGMHRYALQPADFAAPVPEAALALLLTTLYHRWRQVRWARIGLYGTVVTLPLASWFVIVPWIIIGTPPVYPLLIRLVGSSAVIHTVINSPAILGQLLGAVGAFAGLWLFGAIFLIWFQRILTRMSRLIVAREKLVLGLAVLGLFFPFQCDVQTARLAVIVPFSRDASGPSASDSLTDPVALATLGPPHRRQQPSVPFLVKNVLLILMESVRYQPGSLFDYGFPRAVHFDRAYAHHPRSVKTLEALLFGIYPSVPVVTAAWSIDQYAVDRMDPLPLLLRRFGFSTRYYSSMDLDFDNYGKVLQATGFEQVETVSGGNRLTWGTDAATLFERVATTLEAGVRENKPQFIMVWTAECHIPYDHVQEKDPSAAPLVRYLACQQSLAQSIEKLVGRLENSGRLTDTLIVMLGDHGEIFPSEQKGEWGHGVHVYEPSLHVPLLMFVPGLMVGRHDNRLFQLVDVPATILTALRIPVPKTWVGRDMLDPEERGRDFVVLLNSAQSDGTMAVLDKFGHKYVPSQPFASFLSYDLTQDPYEKVRLPVNSEMAAVVNRRLQAYVNFATLGWESQRKITQPISQFHGRTIATQWGKGASSCITVVPDQAADITVVSPVVGSGCTDEADLFVTRSIARTFAIQQFATGVRCEIELMIEGGETVQERQLRALAKTWAMEQPVGFDIALLPGVWQTVSLVLPQMKAERDLVTGQQGPHTVLGLVPVDQPIRYAIRSIKLEPVKSSIGYWPWSWFLQFSNLYDAR